MSVTVPAEFSRGNLIPGCTFAYRWKLWTVIQLLVARITRNLVSLAVLGWVLWQVRGHVAVATHFGKMFIRLLCWPLMFITCSSKRL